MFHENQGPRGIVLSPKASFILGLVGGVLVLCTIGFVILLSIFLRAGGSAGPKAGAYGEPVPSLAPTPSAPSAPAPVGTVKPISKDDHVRGDAKAEVTLYEWSDFECPFCKRFHPTMTQLMSEYKGKVRWVYRHFPLSFHQNAQKEAEASECANELGGNDAFWKYTDKIFERTNSGGTGIALTDLAPIAKEIGLDEGKFQKCLDSGKYAAHVTQDMNDGSSAGVTGTPGTIIVGKDGTSQLVPGAVPYDQLKAMVDSAL